MELRRTQLGAWMLLAMLLPAAAAHAGTTAAVVRGVVRDPQGAPQNGALVQLLAPDASAIATAITDLKGRYSIRGVVPGRYQMRASATLFLPALRRNLKLGAGAQATVDLTLAALGGQWLPARRRDADEADDDWKWTLRAAENRPVLRVLEDGTVVLEGPGGAAQPDAASRRRGLFADRRVLVRTGSGEFAGGGIHSVVLADRAAAGGSVSMVRADVGTGLASSLDMSAGYERNLGSMITSRMAVLYQDHPELQAGSGTGISAMTMLQAQKMQIGDIAEVELGSMMRMVHVAGASGPPGTPGALGSFRMTAAMGSPGATVGEVLPFIKVSAEPVEGILVTYRMATARELQSFADMDSLRPETPLAAVSDGELKLERGRHQEFSVAKRVGGGSVEASIYADHIATCAISGTGTPSQAFAGEHDVVVDPITGTFRLLSPGYDARGFSVSVNEPITRSLWVSGEYNTGNALAAGGAGEIQSQWTQAGMAALEGKWAGGTDLRIAYRWQPRDTLTAVNSYRSDSGHAYLGVVLRRPLHYRSLLPNGLEAVVDVSNLLAQGYRAVGVSADGGTIFLMNTARSVQGGLAFTF